MDQITTRTIMSAIARAATPLSMVVFLTMEIVGSQRDRVSGAWVYVVAAAALGTSIGIEVWGIMAGSNLEKSLSSRKNRVATVIQLALYVGLGMWLLRHNSTLVALPVVAALVYVTVATAEGLDRADTDQRDASLRATEAEAATQSAKDQRDHEFRMAQLQAQKDAKIAADRARAEADATSAAAVARAKADAAIARAEARKASAATPTASAAAHTASTANVRYADEAAAVHAKMNGDPFGRKDVEEILTVGRTKATGVIKTGVDMGLFKPVGNDSYLAVHD